MAKPDPSAQHAEWLGLLRPDGPFLALPVLLETLKQGLDVVSNDVRDEVRQGWNQVQDAPDLLLPGWYDLILRKLLGIPFSSLVQGSSVAELTGRSRPDLVAYGPGAEGRAMRFFIYRHGWDEPLLKGRGDQASRVEQAAAFCRETGVPLALVTNGRFWVLVHARPQEPTSTAEFDADLWLEERLLLRAFATLLGARRSLAPAHRPDGSWSDGLTALFARSAEAHTQVTDTLGRQVRQAVELLVGELARLDRESGGALLRDVPEREIYRGALIVLMRLVFLLYAEEQELMPADELYMDSYGVTALYDHLAHERDLHGDEIGDRRLAAWPRLLALFRAVHSGSEHPDLRIPAYGGSLFDPARHTWLTRATGVTDRVVHEVLDALLVLRHTKGKAAAERLSYKGLGVEQIGHVYEGLLEFSCLKANEPYIGLGGSLEPELRLSEVEEQFAGDRDAFIAWLKKETGLTPKKLEKASNTAPDNAQFGRLRAACDNDDDLAERIRPFYGLLRHDLRDEPAVFPKGSVLFTQVGDRRATGTHYTPRHLAEEIVKHTLDPLCHRPGPAEGAEEDEWQVKPAAELLDLKVCDPAMGSGAFLVSACRYLAERLLEAWERDGIPEDVTGLLGSEYDREDLTLVAKRRAAASCIYGVDRDDMAVELAKLSLWIETLAKDKPFSFLDHALRHGDSLVGLIDEAQVWSFHLNPERGKVINARFENVIEDLIPMLTRAQELREEIEAFPADDIERVTEKARKLAEAERITERLRLAADAVVASALSTADQTDERLDDRLLQVADDVQAVIAADKAQEFTHRAQQSPLEAKLLGILSDWLKGIRQDPIKPLHWSLEFPEIMRRGGFDAVVGNPPFVGGTMIKRRVGADLLSYYGRFLAEGDTAGGRADLCAYFLLRMRQLNPAGRIGAVATNSISQTDTREVGLDKLIAKGLVIYRARGDIRWSGQASVYVSLVWLGQHVDDERAYLNCKPVLGITTTLEKQGRVTGKFYPLTANKPNSFNGYKLNGKEFIISNDEALRLIAGNSRNREVVMPYLGGDELNSLTSKSERRWAINFYDRTLEEAQGYPEAFRIVEERVKPVRQRLNADGSYALRSPLPQRYWQYGDKRPAMTEAIKGQDRVLVIAMNSSTMAPALVPNGQVFSHTLAVFRANSYSEFARLASSLYWHWVDANPSSLKVDTRYNPSDHFDTFPKCSDDPDLEEAGRLMDSGRSDFMAASDIGLTDLSKMIHWESSDESVNEVRQTQVRVDEAVCHAYALDEEREPEIREFEARVASNSLPSWREIELDHGFYETRGGGCGSPSRRKHGRMCSISCWR